MELNVPNIISLFRIVVAPIFFVMFLSHDKLIVAISAPLFLIGAISDYYDGWYARKYNKESKWGIFIDPLADKFLTGVAFLAFAKLGIIPYWMIIVVYFRDFGTTFLRLFADSHQMEIKTSFLAKVKTFLQFTFIAYILIQFFFLNLNIFPDYNIQIIKLIFSPLTNNLMLILAILTVYTLIEYILENKTVIYKLFGY